MDTKMQALEKAQKLFMMLLNDGKQPCITNVESTSVGKYFCVSPVEIKENSIFEYSDPKPLERDTLCMCDDGIMRYAIGELDAEGANKFYVQGFYSKNVGSSYNHFTFKNFEIIETPGDLERVQTPDYECVNSGCARYVNKWQHVESDKFLNGDCERCRIPIGTPSKLQVKK